MSLQEQLDAVHRGILRDAPDAATAFDADTEGLIRTGVGNNAPKVGQLAPDFALPDALGRQVRSKDLRAAGPLVISFYRGNWCPYCNLEIRALQQHLPRIAEQGASLVAISPQIPDESLSMADKHALSFPVLSDVGSLVARRYALVFTVSEPLRPLYSGFGIDLPKSNGGGTFELPVPGTFIIDSNAVVRGAFVDPDYKKRMEPDEILEVLEAMSGEA